MKKYYPHSAISALYVLLLITSCSETNRSDNGIAAQRDTIPFNYNIPNIYVFSVKASDSTDKGVYSDTLGLMCTNKIENKETGQTTSSWLYLSKAANGSYVTNPAKINNSFSGTLSSKETIFIHPPRVEQYTILEICPYPILQFPLFIGKKWDWDLTVGDQWNPGGSVKWGGNKDFRSQYEVVDTTHIEIPIGKISCYHVHAINTSELGTSSADFYYNNQQGIIKLSYQPLDKTKIEFNLLSTTDDTALFQYILPHYQAHQEYLNFIKDSSYLQ